ncbi:TerC family protein [Fodinicola acaciae]|uniref:TerC family protein n=1 Tax=Fodinicola acaciae TaxID=2681555 RepID=UPI00165288D9|nr:TerC family protein [Fodinicola acaciae]
MTTAPLWAWGAVLVAILAMLAVDLFMHRRDREISIREAAIASAAWIAIGLAFGGVVWLGLGAESGAAYYAAYVVEKSLSVDNVFVFALLFTYFAVPKQYQHRVLFFGVIGALIMRAVFIFAGSALISQFHWIIYIFGAFLVYTGIKLARSKDDDEVDPEKNLVLRFVRRVVPMTQDVPGWRGHRFWVREGGKWIATPLFAVLIAVETTDLIFAVDSIPAVFGVTTDAFIIFTSNAFAILGLRALYFLLAGAMKHFAYLQLGLAAVLTFVGAKMLLTDIFPINIWVSLAVIVALLTTAIVASLVKARRQKELVS